MSNATSPATQPHPYVVSKGPASAKWLQIDPGNDIWLFSANGVPQAGTSGTGAGWAGIGSLCVDSTTGKWYTNTGTKASPTWTVVGSQS